jgi:hypothetical protein
MAFTYKKSAFAHKEKASTHKKGASVHRERAFIPKNDLIKGENVALTDILRAFLTAHG